MLFSVNGSERMRIDSSGNVGLGTTTIRQRLHQHVADSGANYHAFTNTSTGTGATDGFVVGISADEDALVWNQESTNLILATSGSEKMRINSSGNIQFTGSTSNTTVLSLNTSDGSDTKQLSLAGGGADSDGRGARMRLYGNEHSSSAGVVDIATGNIAGSDMFLTATDKIILSASAVGIGTTSPAQKLDVVGKMKISDDIILAQTNGRIDYDNGVSTGALRFHSTSGNAERMRITSAGNVGIGETNPATNLDIKDASGSTDLRLRDSGDNTTLFLQAQNGISVISTVTDHPLRFDTNDTERMRVSNDGLVSIKNASTPTLRLDNTDTSLGTDQILGTLEFNQNDPSSDGVGVVAKINALNESSFAGIGALTFHTGSATSISEKARLDSSGRLGIRNPNPTVALDVLGTDNLSSRFIFTKDLSTDKVLFGGADHDTFGAPFIGSSSAHSFTITQGGGAAITIDTSKNVGIGTTAPFCPLQIAKSSSTSNTGNDSSFSLCLSNTDDTNNNLSLIGFNDGSNALDGQSAVIGCQYIDHTNNYGDLLFITRGAGGYDERLRIKNDGALRIATTSHVWNDRELVTMKRITGEVYATQTDDLNYSHWVAKSNAASSSTHFMAYFVKSDNSNVGSITHNDTNTSFNTSSDYRLKEDLKDFNALEIASKIKMYDFKWKEADSRSYGVMAHELQEVLPQAVVGDKDGKDMQGVDYSKLVPILLKSIQELEARVQELEKEI